MDDGAVAAGGLAEDGAPAGAAAAQLALDHRHHLVDQIVLVAADGGAVDVLVAAEAAEAIGKGHDHRRHAALADQAIEALRHVLGEGTPVGVDLAGTGEADDIDQRWIAPARVISRPAGRLAARGSSGQVALRALRFLDGEAANLAGRHGAVSAHGPGSPLP
jgi:hypothetical protein